MGSKISSLIINHDYSLFLLLNCLIIGDHLSPPIPFTEEGLQAGFKTATASHLTSQKEPFSFEDARQYLDASGFNPDQIPDLITANMRTDGNARHLMIQSVLKGFGTNEKELLENTDKPFTIVIGMNDVFINNEYIEKKVKYSSLYDMYSLDCGHAPHWEMPTEFNSILDQFAQKVLGK